MTPRYNEPRYNEDPVITNVIWKPGRITVKYAEKNPAITNPAMTNRFWWSQRHNEWSLNDIDDFPQVLLLLLNFKVLNWKCSWNLYPDCPARDTYSLQYQKCGIEFLVILNYPAAITNIFAINQIIRFYGVFAITKTPL